MTGKVRTIWTTSCPSGRGGGGGDWALSGSGERSSSVHPARDQAPWVEREWGAVLPAFAERRLHVVDRRALNCHLHVVPGRGRAVGLGELHRLRVAVVVRVVTPAVAQVDTADVGDVAGRVLGVPDHHELLVVGAAVAHAHVPQALTAGLADLFAQVAMPVGAEAETVPVGPPQQPSHVDAALRRRDQCGVEGRPGVIGELLVRVTSPVGEVEAVPGAEAGDALVELLEVGPPVDDGPDVVAAAPGGAVAADVVDPGVRVLPLLAGQEPCTHIHGAHLVCLVKRGVSAR